MAAPRGQLLRSRAGAQHTAGTLSPALPPSMSSPKAARRVAQLQEHLQARDKMSSFADVPQAPPDAILGISEAFRADTDPRKLNLGVGAYRTEEGKPLVLRAVKEAERRLLADASQNHEYLSQAGLPDFCSAAAALALGRDSAVLAQKRSATVQALSGTGALRVGGEFLARFYSKSKLVLIPTPTWPNHRAVFERSGLTVQQYRYYLPQTKGLDFDGLIADLSAAPPGAVVVLHACAHNPTGVDPTPDQWRGILSAVQSRGLLPFFDSAYQGFASGDLERDGAAVRLFADAGLELLLAQSFAKNLGLYGERVGALTLVTSDPAVVPAVLSQLKGVVRAMYSNPPKHGAAIAGTVLNDPQLFNEWKVELKAMAERIILMRRLLHEALVRKGAPGDWSHIVNQIGMFSFLGLTRPQVEHMTSKWHVYMTLDGRISMPGLSTNKCEYLADAIIDSVKSCP